MVELLNGHKEKLKGSTLTNLPKLFFASLALS
jgi:hypothetical protein